MGILSSSLVNLVRLPFALLTVPGRLLRSSSRPRYVRFRLKGNPPYRARRRRLRLLRRPEPGVVTSLQELRRQLTIVCNDARARGVLFEVEDLNVPAAKRQALVKLFELVRKAGKEVVAFAVAPSTEEYGLLCCADKVVFPAAGRLELTGFAVEAMALGGTLRHLGVAAHFVRRGDYKTAPELFTHDTVSDIQRQTLETFLDERYAELIGLIARGRRISEEEARRKVDGGPYSARRALQEGLCDVLCSEADLEDLLAGKKVAGRKGGERLVEFDRYAAHLSFPPWRWRPLKTVERLGLVKVDGIIAQGEGGLGLLSPKVAGSGALGKALRAAGRDKACRAVLLYVNSPGGSATASEMLLEDVRRLAKKKPVLAYFDRVAASGGYQAALGARQLWAGPHAIVGSIGVFAGKFDFSALLERAGIQREVLIRGAHAGSYSPSRPFSPDERRALEAEVEETYQAFLEQVASARKLSREEVHRRAEGRLYSGTAAQQAGLVDGTCGFEEACRRALELAGVREPYHLKSYTGDYRRFSLRMTLGQLVRGGGVYALMLPWLNLPELSSLWEDAEP